MIKKGAPPMPVSPPPLPDHQGADKPGRVALAVVQDHWLRRLRFHMPSFDDCRRAVMIRSEWAGGTTAELGAYRRSIVVIGAERIELSTPFLKARWVCAL